jgi:uncharacterized protein
MDIQGIENFIRSKEISSEHNGTYVIIDAIKDHD